MRKFSLEDVDTTWLTQVTFSLRELDIELMRRLSPRVNVIPVIGKADSLTPSELRGFKKRVSDALVRISPTLWWFLFADHGRH